VVDGSILSQIVGCCSWC